MTDDGFGDVLARLRTGDNGAASEVFRRYVRQMISLAGRQFEASLRERADVEDVVQSALKSFFLRTQRGEFRLDRWEELWGLLAAITLRKCARRYRQLKSARRDPAREVSPEFAVSWTVPDRSPSPEELAVFRDILGHMFTSLDPEDQPIIEHILMGFTAGETAERLDCSERTVRRVRQRARSRLHRLIEPDSVGS